MVLSSGHTNRPQPDEPPEMDVHIQYPCPKVRWLLDGLDFTKVLADFTMDEILGDFTLDEVHSDLI